MFDEPVFFLCCCITANFEATENSLIRHFDVYITHIGKKNFIQTGLVSWLLIRLYCTLAFYPTGQVYIYGIFLEHSHEIFQVCSEKIRYEILHHLGDVEFDPGLKPDSSQSFSICHWNLNMSVHNYSKISLLTAYIFIHDFDIIYLSLKLI